MRTETAKFGTSTFFIMKAEYAQEPYHSNLPIHCQNISLRGTKKLLNCHQRMKYQLIFSRSRSGVLGATTIDSQGVLIFYENSYLGEMWPLSLKLEMPRSDLRAMK